MILVRERPVEGPAMCYGAAYIWSIEKHKILNNEKLVHIHSLSEGLNEGLNGVVAFTVNG